MKKMAFVLTFLIAGAASASVTKVKTCNAETGVLDLALEVKGKQIVQTEYYDGKAGKVTTAAVLKAVEISAEDLKEYSAYFKISSGFIDGSIYGMDGDGVLLAKSADGVDYVILITPASLELMGTSATCK